MSGRAKTPKSDPQATEARDSERPAPRREGATVAEPSGEAPVVRRALGNMTIQRLVASGGGTPPAPGPATQAALSRKGLGSPLPPALRGGLERAFAADLSGVRLHADAHASDAARELRARAFTHGQDVFLGAGGRGPETASGRALLAHELAHTIQQRSAAPQLPRGGGSAGPVVDRPDSSAEREAASAAEHLTSGSAPVGPLTALEGGPPLLQRQDEDSGDTGIPTDTGAATGSDTPPAAPPASTNVNLVPPEWMREPGPDDILAARAAGRMVALPAQGAIVILRPPEGAHVPTEPLFTVPTIAKEGLVAVNVGGRTGFLIDAGGNPAVVFPHALAQIQEALGIQSIRGLVVTHIHDDHVQSFVTLVENARIAPGNLYYPAAFTANVNAPSSVFARAVAAVQADPTLRALGHGPEAAYGVIPTPAGGAFFRRTLQEGDVTFDFYGLTDQFRRLEADRMAGRRPSNADTASLLTRITHHPSGFRVLYVGDLRGSDLTLFRQAMGEAAYSEMLTGVRVIQGLQHHMGALESPADRTGLIQLLRDTYLRSGELSVIVQTQERYGGKQFINRSLIRALSELGIDVEVAMEPRAPDQVGTITTDTSGRTTRTGGTIESHPGAQELQSHVRRLLRLREAEEILTNYEQFLTEPGRRSREVRQAREALEQALNEYLETTIGNVRTGEKGREQNTLRDPAAQTAALQRVRASQPVEDTLTPANMARLRELNQYGPYRVIWEQELAESRRTGRISERGIEALWELEPETARRLVQTSGVSRGEQRRAIRQLPGQPLVGGTRIMGGVLIAVSVLNELSPLIQQHNVNAFDANVGRQLRDILWWQNKGVRPNMEGLDDNWSPFYDDERTTSVARIQELLNERELDYLALTGIDDQYWDAFTVWATSQLQNLLDWRSQIMSSGAIRGTGEFVNDKRWEYRVTRIVETTLDYDIEEEWVFNERLNTILRAAANHMVETTERQIEAIATEPGPRTVTSISSLEYRESRPIYSDMPRAVGKKRFKASADPVLYTINSQRSRSGYSRDAVFYQFPNSASPEPVPEGYVVVGGADYNTFADVLSTDNLVKEAVLSASGSIVDVVRRVHPNHYQVMLAWAEDLEDAP